MSKGLGVGRESVVFEIRTASRLAQGWFRGAAAALWDTREAFETSLKAVGFALPPLRMVQKHPGAARNPKTTESHHPTPHTSSANQIASMKTLT